jgi:hypothetical protein
MASTSFDSFDWDHDDRWQQYLANVNYPGNDPQAQLYFIDKIKRKWFKTHIDPAFDATPPSAPPSSAAYSSPAFNHPSPPPRATSPPPPPSSSSRSSSYSPPPPSSSASASSAAAGAGLSAGLKDTLGRLTLYCNVGILILAPQYLLPLFVSSLQAYFLVFAAAIITYLIGFFGDVGLPTAPRAWLARVAADARGASMTADNLHFMLYALIFLLHPGYGILPMVPVLIPAFHTVCMTIHRANLCDRLPAVIGSPVQRVIVATLANSMALLGYVTIFQLMIFPLVLFSAFSSTGILVLIAYFFFLSLRRRSSELTRQLLWQLSTDVGARCPAVILPWFRRVEQILSTLSHTLAP